MRHVRSILVALALATLGATAASADSPRRIDAREWRQHDRIQQGWRSGRLTRVERARLRAGQRHIHRMEWRSMRDGRLDPRERRSLMRAQDRQSWRIYRLDHNRRSRII